MEVLHTEVILQDLVPGQVVLALQTSAVLGHVDDGAAVAVGDPFDELAEADCVRAQPRRLRLGSNGRTVLVFEEKLEVAVEVLGIGFSRDVLDVVGAVVVPGRVSNLLARKLA